MQPDLHGVVHVRGPDNYLQDPSLVVVRFTSSGDKLDSQPYYQKKGVLRLPRCGTLVQYFKHGAGPGGLGVFEKERVMVLTVCNSG